MRNGWGAAIQDLGGLFHDGGLSGLDDRALIERFLTGEGDHADRAFAAIVSRHGAIVLAAARRGARDDSLADDAFQAAFLILARRARSLRQEGSLAGWLHRVAYRLGARARRNALRRRERESRVRPQAPSIDRSERDEVRSAIHEELARLPGLFRAPIVLCHLLGRTHEQAAIELECPVGTVRSRLARGRERMRRRLDRRGFAPSAIAAGWSSEGIDLAPIAGRVVLRGGSAALASADVMELVKHGGRTMIFEPVKLVGMIAVGTGLVLAGWMGVGRAVDEPAPQKPPIAAAKADPKKTKLFAAVVRDPEGRPMAGARVVVRKDVFDDPRSPFQFTTTEADGRVTWDVASHPEYPTMVWAVAAKEGWAPGSAGVPIGGKPYPGQDLELGTLAKPVEIVLFPPAPFQGIVLDDRDQPVAGAEVFVQRSRVDRAGPGEPIRNGFQEDVLRGTPLEGSFTAKTDDRGVFLFPSMPRDARLTLTIRARGMADLEMRWLSWPNGNEDLTQVRGTPEAPARLVMKPGSDLHGRVVSKVPGVSVANRFVVLQGCDGIPFLARRAFTDAQGRFTMTGLPECEANVMLHLDGRDENPPWTARAAANVAFRPGQLAEATVEILEGVIVEGRVVEAGTGKPVPGAFVGMYGPERPRSGAAILSVTADGEGRYRFRLPPGPTYLYFPGGLEGVHRLPGERSALNIDIPEGEKRFAVDDIEVGVGDPTNPEAGYNPRAEDGQALPGRLRPGGAAMPGFTRNGWAGAPGFGTKGRSARRWDSGRQSARTSRYPSSEAESSRRHPARKAMSRYVTGPGFRVTTTEKFAWPATPLGPGISIRSSPPSAMLDPRGSGGGTIGKGRRRFRAPSWGGREGPRRWDRPPEPPKRRARTNSSDRDRQIWAARDPAFLGCPRRPAIVPFRQKSRSVPQPRPA